MPSIDPTALANIQALALKERADVCEYIKVTWNTGVIRYYGGAAYQDFAPFTSIGVTIDPRIIYSNPSDRFTEFEINPDLRTESISITFDDIDKEITGKFQTYGSGVTCEIYLYYADEDKHVAVWHGQLQAPNVYGWKQIKAVATNGYRSRELTVPSRRRPKECTANIFGGRLPDTDAVRSSLCPYDKHLGGSVGNYKTGVTPYAGCPKTRDACIDRLSNNGKYFGGFVTDASSMVTDPNGWLAVSRGNASNNKEPIRVIFGTKTVKGLPLLLWAPQRVASDPKNSYVRGVWEIGEGPIADVWNFKANNVLIGQQHLNFRLGTRGQTATNYTADVSNFSSTAHIFGVTYYFDLTNVSEFNPTEISTECQVQGFAEVCVYTDDSPVTKTRIWSDNRVWCLLELYKNQKFGLGYAESKFTLADWITESTWSDHVVKHTVTDADGGSTDYISRRSTFNAILEGRAVGEQIEDICRSGGLSVPFEDKGKFTIRSFRAATAGELSAAKVFYDTGSSVNVCWLNGQPAIELSQTPDNKLVNEVEVRFEEAANNGTERPITVDDPNWKLKAGRQQGPNYFLSVPKKFSGFGITSLAEALRFGYRMLKFGEFDEGGTDNNLRVKLTVPFEQVLNLTRYDIIKVRSEILDGHTVGNGGTLETLSGTTAYPFRILKMKKISGGRCEIVAQAYNKTAYEAFEVDDVSTVSSNPCVVYGAGSFICDDTYEYVGQLNSKPSYAVGTKEIQWSSSKWRIYVDGTQYYESSSAVAFPWLATWTTTAPDGESPEPFVSEGIPTLGGGGSALTINAPSYSSTTGILSVVIN